MVRIGRIEPATRPPRARRRWWRRVAVAFAIAAAVVGIGVPVAVAAFGPALLMRVANARVPGRLSVAAARFTWPCRVELRGLVLSDDQGRAAARISSVQLDLDVVATATVRPTGRLVIASPWVDLAIDAAGESVLVRAIVTPTAGAAEASPATTPAPPPDASAPHTFDGGIPLPDVDVAIEITGAAATNGGAPLVGPLNLAFHWSGAITTGALEVRETRSDAIDVDVQVRSTRPGVIHPAALVLDVRRLSVDRLSLVRLGPYLSRATGVVIDQGELTLMANGRWAAGAGEGQASVRLTGVELHGAWSGGAVLRPPEVALRVTARGAWGAPVAVLATMEAGELCTLGVELRLDPDASAAPEAAGASLGVATARIALAPLAALARPWIAADAPRLDGTLDATVQLRRTPSRGSALRVESRFEPTTRRAPADTFALPGAMLSIEAGRAAPDAPFAVTRASLDALGCRASAHLQFGPGLELVPGAGGARLKGDLARVSRALPAAWGFPRSDGEVALDLAWDVAEQNGSRKVRATLGLTAVALELPAGRVGPLDLEWEQSATWGGPAADRIALGKGMMAGGGLALVVSGDVADLRDAAGPSGSLSVAGSVDPGPLLGVLGRHSPVSIDGDSVTIDLRAHRAAGRERVELSVSGSDLAWGFAAEDSEEPGLPGRFDDFELTLAVERTGPTTLVLESLSARVGRAALVGDGELELPRAEGEVPRARLMLVAELVGSDLARGLAPVLQGWSFDAHAAIDVVVRADAAGQSASLEVDLAHGTLAHQGKQVWDEGGIAVAATALRPSGAVDADALARVGIVFQRLIVRGRTARLAARGMASPAELADLFYANAPPDPSAAARRLVIEGTISPRDHHAAELARRLGLETLGVGVDLRLAREVRGPTATFDAAVAGHASVGFVGGGTWTEPAFGVRARATATPSARELALEVVAGAGRVAAAGIANAADVGTAALAADGAVGLEPLVARGRSAGILPAGAAVSGTVGVALGLATHEGRTRADAFVRADPVRVASIGLPPTEEALTARAYLVADRRARRVVLEHLALDGPTLAGGARGSVTWPADSVVGAVAELSRVSVAFGYHPTRLGRLLALVAPGLSMEGERRQAISLDFSGPLDTDSDALSILRGLQGRAAVDVDSLDAGGYRFVGRSRLSLVDQVLRSQHRYSMSGQEARAGMALDLREVPHARSRVALSLKEVVVRSGQAGWLAYLNPLFFLGTSNEGMLDGCFGVELDTTYAGPLGAVGWEALDKKPLTGVVRLDVIGMNALQSPFLDRINDLLGAVGPRLVPRFEPLTVSIRDERFHYDRALRVELGGNAVYLDGSVGFDRTVDMEMVAPLVPEIAGRLPILRLLPKPELRIPLRGVLGGALFDLEAVLRELGERLSSLPDPRELLPHAIKPLGR